MLVSRWLWRWLTRPCWSADGTTDAGVLVCAPLSRSLRRQDDALDGAAGSVTNSALSLAGAASCCAALRAAALRCELRAAPRCSGLVAPSGTRGLGNPAAVKRF